MNRILIRLTAFNLVALTATFVVGWLSYYRDGVHTDGEHTFMTHVLLGIASVTTTLAVHCIVFIYFLGTGRWVKEVAIAYRLPDDPLPRRTRELKRKAYPAALAAMLIAIAAAATGAGRQVHHWPALIHASLAVLTLAVNAWAFWVEYRCVTLNAGIIDAVMAQVDRIRAERGLPSNAEALRQQHEQEQAV